MTRVKLKPSGVPARYCYFRPTASGQERVAFYASDPATGKPTILDADDAEAVGLLSTGYFEVVQPERASASQPAKPEPVALPDAPDKVERTRSAPTTLAAAVTVEEADPLDAALSEAEAELAGDEPPADPSKDKAPKATKLGGRARKTTERKPPKRGGSAKT